jgi:HD-like signal output (HDOD) protein
MNKSQALSLIAEQALGGELIFSASVSTSLKVQEAIDDGDCNIDTASKIILNEPLLAAKVVSVANSVAFTRSSSPVTNVRLAIARIGFNTLRALVSALVMKQIAGASKNPVIRSKINQLWEHSAQVAALAQVMSRRVTKCNPDNAMFAGIVHEVGGFYILSRAEEFPCLLEPDDLNAPPLDNDVNIVPNTFIERESHESIIGRAVLQNLNMPANILEAVEAVWFGMRAMPPETLGDVLLLANELAKTASPLDTRTDSASNPCESVIDFVVGEGTLKSILEESEDEVQSLTAALII